MSSVNRDTIVALCLLAFCGAFFAATFEIRDPGYATIGARVWPRLILAALVALTLIYLFQSLRRAPGGEAGDAGTGIGRYRNALWCYALFFLFLVTLPFFGMLIGGVLFVYLALTVMGERTLRAHLVHAAIAVGTIGTMWAIFTYWLRVILPQGELLRVW